MNRYIGLLFFLYFIVPLNAQDYENSIGQKMIYIKGGEIDIDSADSTRHLMCRNIYLSETELTNTQYHTLTQILLAEVKRGNQPVNVLNWYDAINFCNALSLAEGFEPCYKKVKSTYVFLPEKNGYRLPTALEWEYAARGGIKTKIYEYSGSNNIDEVAWYDSVESNYTPRQIHEVKQKKPNELGFYDMSGNLWEWCWDSANEVNSKNDVFRVIKGGSFAAAKYMSKIGYSGYQFMTTSADKIGIRLCRNAESK